MTFTLDDYRHELITKVLFAASQEEVKRFCEAAVRQLELQQLNGPLIADFLAKTLEDLQQFSPMNKEAQQWSNIVSAKIFCKRLVRRYSVSNE